jgi:hypothetical protein
VISPRPAKDPCTSLSVCDGGDEAKDGEEDFELFAKETVRERMERRITDAFARILRESWGQRFWFRGEWITGWVCEVGRGSVCQAL